jgi:hypothetical protein
MARILLCYLWQGGSPDPPDWAAPKLVCKAGADAGVDQTVPYMLLEIPPVQTGPV